MRKGLSFLIWTFALSVIIKWLLETTVMPSGQLCVEPFLLVFLLRVQLMFELESEPSII